MQVWQSGLQGRIHWQLGRTFAERYKEHMKAQTPIYDHLNTTGHDISVDNSSIVGREDKNLEGLSKKLFSSELITHPLIEILANTNCHKYGMKYWWIQQNLSSSNKPNNIQLSGDTTSISYMLVLTTMNHNISLSHLDFSDTTCHIHTGSLTPSTKTN